LRDAFKDAVPLRNALADYAGLPFVTFIFAGAAAWTWRRLRRRSPDPLPPGIAGSLLPASLAGVAAAGVVAAFAAGLAGALNDQRHESVILAHYLEAAGWDLSLSLLWLPFMASALALAEPLFGRAGPRLERAPPSRGVRVRAAAGLALWLVLPLAARLNLHRPLQQPGFWTRLDFEDLRALRAVEAAIPPNDGVIIPAEHAIIPNWEHWVLPLGDTAALLPYGERRYLFNVYLGASYPFSWRDLENVLCSRNPARRSQFLERTHARWVLVRDLEAMDAKAAVQRPQMCGLSFAELGAELPAVREERGIFLFRLGQGPLGADRAAR
jgi:hypothetical protein